MAAVAAVLMVLMLNAGCIEARHGRPIFGGSTIPNERGTVSGIVRTTTGTQLPGRKVSAINVATGAHFDVTTSRDGGYTLEVPVGEYRLDLTLNGGETIAKQPKPTKVNPGDLDEELDFAVSR
jgi:hypothetical protein